MIKLVTPKPSVIVNCEWKDVALCYNQCQSQLASAEEVKNDFCLQWKAMCTKMKEGDRPSTALKALDIVPTRCATIKILLWLFCTMPVSTCTVERSFSTIKLLKNCLRSTMTVKRITRRALIYIHPDVNIYEHEVINRFATSSRRILFALQSGKRQIDDMEEGSAGETDSNNRVLV